MQIRLLKSFNKKGTLLPETGGMGTVIFTAVAVVLIFGVAAALYLAEEKVEDNTKDRKGGVTSTFPQIIQIITGRMQ